MPQLARGEVDPALNAGPLGIAAGGSQHNGITVGPTDGNVALPFAPRSFGQQRLPKPWSISGPGHEGELSLAARRPVAGKQGGLNGESSRTAHGVKQRDRAIPAEPVVPGRLQRFEVDGVAVHVDVGHNPQAARELASWLRGSAEKLGVDPARIVAAGGSAGGHVAACTATIEGFDDDPV